jgi:hypothetical protein
MKDYGAIMANSNKFDESFTAAIDGFRVSTGDSKGYARTIADMSISVFFDNGNLAYAMRFIAELDDVGKDYIRKQAYLSWLAYHSPIELDEKGAVLLPLRKDKSEGAQQFKIELAHATPFWEYEPEKVIIVQPFGAQDIISDVHKLLAKYRNGNKYRAEGLGAVTLAKAGQLAVTLEAETAQALAELAKAREANKTAEPEETPAETAERMLTPAKVVDNEIVPVHDPEEELAEEPSEEEVDEVDQEMIDMVQAAQGVTHAEETAA